MDNGDFVIPTWASLASKGPDRANCSDHDLNESSPTASEPCDNREDLSRQTSQTYNTLMAELHKEIDCSEFIGKTELQKIISSKLKNLLEKVLSKACRSLNVLEHLRTAVLREDRPEEGLDRAVPLHMPSLQALLLQLGFSQNLDEVQSYLTSADRTCLLSELDSVRTELADLQRRHQSTIRSLHHSLHLADQEKNQVHATLQQSLQASQEQVQSLQQQLHSSHHTVQSLRRDLRLAEDTAVSLRRDLKGQEEGGQALLTALRTAEDHARLLRQDARASEELCCSLQQALSACEARAQEAEARGRSEEEGRAEGERRIRRLTKAYQKQEARLKGTAEVLQGQLTLLREREVKLEQDIADSRAEVEEVQRASDRAREQAEARDRELCAEIIVLKNKLLEEHTNLNKELEKSMMYEKELHETIKHLRQAVTTHKEGRDLALECLRKRCQDVADVQRLLEADIRHCSSQVAAEKQISCVPLSERLCREIKDLRKRMNKEAKADGRGGEHWAELLNRADEWEKEAERLVGVLESLRTWTWQKGKLQGEELLDLTPPALHRAVQKPVDVLLKPCQNVERLAEVLKTSCQNVERPAEVLKTSCQNVERPAEVLLKPCQNVERPAEVLKTSCQNVERPAEVLLKPCQSLAVPLYCPLARPASATLPTPRRDSGHHSSEANPECLLSLQKRLRTVQSVHFQNSTRELSRNS